MHSLLLLARFLLPLFFSSFLSFSPRDSSVDHLARSVFHLQICPIPFDSVSKGRESLFSFNA